MNVNGIELLRIYAGFEQGAITNNETNHTGLGYSVAYHGREKGEATIYIYGKTLTDIPDGPASPPTREEYEQAIAEVASIAGRAIELIGTYVTGSPERGMEFLCAEFRLSDTKGTRRTFLYLTAAGGRFVKLRVTLRTDDETDATARNFADAVAIGLWRTQENG